MSVMDDRLRGGLSRIDCARAAMQLLLDMSGDETDRVPRIATEAMRNLEKAVRAIAPVMCSLQSASEHFRQIRQTENQASGVPVSDYKQGMIDGIEQLASGFAPALIGIRKWAAETENQEIFELTYEMLAFAKELPKKLMDMETTRVAAE